MRPLPVVLTLIVGLLLASSLFAQSGPPKQEKLVFENQFVKVYEATLKAGETLPFHHGGNRLIYSLNNYKLLYHWEGKTFEENRKAGDVHFHPEATHAEENPGKSVARFLIVERQSAPLPPANGTGADMARVNPNNTKVIFDRDMAKVFEVTLHPNETLSSHYCPDRLVYSPGGGNLVFTGQDGAKTKVAMKKGGYQWYPSGLVELQNAGPGKTTFVVFGFKR
jgi:hypothetical protein